MRVRALDASGDYTFGRGAANFLIDTPAAVAQLVRTRLGLLRGEWFLDVTEGFDLAGKVQGYQAAAARDIEIRRVILETPGVTSITSYSSAVDPVTRKMTMQATVATAYGETTIEAAI